VGSLHQDLQGMPCFYPVTRSAGLLPRFIIWPRRPTATLLSWGTTFASNLNDSGSSPLLGNKRSAKSWIASDMLISPSPFPLPTQCRGQEWEQGLGRLDVCSLGPSIHLTSSASVASTLGSSPSAQSVCSPSWEVLAEILNVRSSLRVAKIECPALWLR
jgi:hypothetical protein